MARRAKTAFDDYVDEQMPDPEFAREAELARIQIAAVDHVMRVLDAARRAKHLSKADLARRAGAPLDSIRRLMTTAERNPTLGTISKLAHILGYLVELVPEASVAAKRRSTPVSKARTMRKTTAPPPSRGTSAARQRGGKTAAR